MTEVIVKLNETFVPGGYDQRWFKIEIPSTENESHPDFLIKLSGNAFSTLLERFNDKLDHSIVALGYEEFLKNRKEVCLADIDVRGISLEFLEKGQLEVKEISPGSFSIRIR